CLRRKRNSWRNRSNRGGWWNRSMSRWKKRWRGFGDISMKTRATAWLSGVRGQAAVILLPLMVLGTWAHAEDQDGKARVRIGGSLMGDSVSLRMPIDDPVVQRQLRMGARSAQTLKKAPQEPAAEVIRIEVPPGSH